MTGRSLWLDELDPGLVRRASLQGDIDADVVVVGGGFSGLWTAYYLRRVDPSISVVVLEREHVGFGASGRNGGWVVGEFAADIDKYARLGGTDAAKRQLRALFDAVDEVGRVAAAEGIDCGWAKGGAVRMARNEPQRRRQIDEVSHQRSLGFGNDVIRLLDPDETRAMVGATGILGGIHFGPCAAIDPARLVQGLADATEAAGAVIHECSGATRIDDGLVRTDSGSVRAPMIVQATEAYTRDLPGRRRRMVPIYSRMVATEPLPAEVLNRIGLKDRPTFADDRYMVIYGQRTEDGRIAFGGRGVPYRYGSRIDAETEIRGHQHVESALLGLFPVLADFEITHRWGGVLGAGRNWTPSVGFAPERGRAGAGGYVGEGVAAANLAGRTLADLIAGIDSERVGFPWVNVPARKWEPEPLRWLAIHGTWRVMAGADRIENRGREAGFAVRLMRRLRGG